MANGSSFVAATAALISFSVCSDCAVVAESLIVLLTMFETDCRRPAK